MNEDNVNNKSSTTETAPIIFKSDELPLEPIKKSKGSRIWKELLNILITLVIVVVVVVGVLYAVKQVAGYESMGALLNVIFEELIFIWKRIIKAE